MSRCTHVLYASAGCVCFARHLCPLLWWLRGCPVQNAYEVSIANGRDIDDGSFTILGYSSSPLAFLNNLKTGERSVRARVEPLGVASACCVLLRLTLSPPGVLLLVTGTGMACA